MKLSHIRWAYDRLEEAVPTVLFLAIFVMMCVGVLLRYVFGVSIAWNVEFSLWSFVWMTFLGGAKVRKDNAHIKVDLLYAAVDRRMRPVARAATYAFKELIIFTFYVSLIFLSMEMAERSQHFPSQAMQLPRSYLFISVGAGAIVFLVREVLDVWKTLRRGFNEPFI